MSKHSEENSSKSDICDTEFSSATKLGLYTMAHYMENPHESDVFNEWISLIENIKIPKSIDTEENSFIFGIGNKELSTSKSLALPNLN